ncbi:MAG: OmpA family protein [Parvibaculum sp.]
MMGFATRDAHENRLSGEMPARRPAVLPLTIACTLILAMSFSRSAAADPLSPVSGTIEKVTDNTAQTVPGLSNIANGSAGTLGLPPLQGPAAQPAPSRQATPDEYRPYDAYQSGFPDTLPGGTLARIYFQPGETALDGRARNEVAGFANAFADRVGNVEIRGYADRSGGNDAGASDIAMQRALAVQQALLAQGIDTARVRASGMGNTDVADAAQDRVDILFDGY